MKQRLQNLYWSQVEKATIEVKEKTMFWILHAIYSICRTYYIQKTECWVWKACKEENTKRIPDSSWSLILAIVIGKIQETDPSFTVTNPWL